VTNELLLEPSRGEGPVGTGVHVLRRTQGPSGSTIADVWLTVLFVPVVPFGEWTLKPGAASTPSWVVTRVARPHPLASVAWVAAGALAIVSSLLPAYAAITLSMGSKPVELGGLFSSAGAVIAALGWLDETRDRVPFGTAVRVLRRAAKSPGQGW
jgi:hypothetical protein